MKFARGPHAKVSPVNDVDVGVYQLMQSEQLLSRKVESLSQESERCKEEARRACRAGKKQLVGSLLLQPRSGIPSCQGQGPAVQRTASLGFRRQHLQVALAPQLTLYREKAWMFLWLWFELGCPASALWPTMSHPDLFPYPPGTEVSQGQAEDRETH